MLPSTMKVSPRRSQPPSRDLWDAGPSAPVGGATDAPTEQRDTDPASPIRSDGSVDPEDAFRALSSRDERYRGTFFYAVLTTGVYCRVGCAARLPRRENVSFFATAEAAEGAGYRACRRCRPDQGSAETIRARLVEGLCRWIEGAEREPTLNELAERLGKSPSYTHKLFRQTIGMSPKAYAAAHRAQRTRAALSHASTVTEAIYDAGYASSSRFYDQADSILGMTPGAYRERGRGHRVRYSVSPCSLGLVLVAVSERGVCAISLGDDAGALEEELVARFPHAERLEEGGAEWEQVRAALALVEDPKSAHTIPLDIQGTAFQRRVWRALMDIGGGQTSTYSKVANAIGKPKAVRAVARACAQNSLAIAIPCHRVVAQSGALAGYRWGVTRKERLLDSERS